MTPCNLAPEHNHNMWTSDRHNEVHAVACTHNGLMEPSRQLHRQSLNFMIMCVPSPVKLSVQHSCRGNSTLNLSRCHAEFVEITVRGNRLLLAEYHELTCKFPLASVSKESTNNVLKVEGSCLIPMALIKQYITLNSSGITAAIQLW